MAHQQLFPPLSFLRTRTPLSAEEIAELVRDASMEMPLPPCRCGFAPQDYCRTCDDFYFIHARDCRLHTSEHDGHCCVLIPFVEKPLKLLVLNFG